MYHIVIACFPSESQADEFIAGVDRNECKHVSKVVRDGKYRIYADKFDNREAAESYMATLRSNPKYKDAWLFISRWFIMNRKKYPSVEKLFSTEGYLKNVRTGFRYYCFLLFIFLFRF